MSAQYLVSYTSTSNTGYPTGEFLYEHDELERFNDGTIHDIRHKAVKDSLRNTNGLYKLETLVDRIVRDHIHIISMSKL